MEIFLIAVALAMDSVALSVASGARHRSIGLGGALKLGASFAFFQGLMPLIGFFLGKTFVAFVAQIDHFIAFGILSYLGAKMIMEAKNPPTSLESLGIGILIFGGVATSIDALAVGVTLSFEAVNIFEAAAVISGVCLVLCVFAVFVGKFLGAKIGAKALLVGGAILIGLGTKILLEHLGFLPG